MNDLDLCLEVMSRSCQPSRYMGASDDVRQESRGGATTVLGRV